MAAARQTRGHCSRATLDHLRAVITVGPAGDLRGPTVVELRILGLLLAGWSDARIAAALDTTEHAVATHRDRTAAARKATSRVAAAVRAVRSGRYVPGEMRSYRCPRPRPGVDLGPARVPTGGGRG